MKAVGILLPGFGRDCPPLYDPFTSQAAILFGLQGIRVALQLRLRFSIFSKKLTGHRPCSHN